MAAVASPVVTVTTDVVKVDIDPVGGVIKRLEMLQYRDHFDKTKNQVLFSVNGPNVYLGQTGLIGTTASGVLPNHTTAFTVRPGVRTLGANGQVQVVMDAEQGGVQADQDADLPQGRLPDRRASRRDQHRHRAGPAIAVPAAAA